jgi:hypothetical protein
LSWGSTVIGVDRAHVAPVGVALAILVAKRKRLHAVRVDRLGENVVAEVVPAPAVVGVAPQLLEEEGGRKAVDAHRRQRHPGHVEERGGIGHLLPKRPHLPGAVHFHRAEFARLGHGHGQRADRHVGPALLVGVDQ